MKKLIILAFLPMLLLFYTACGEKTENKQQKTFPEKAEIREETDVKFEFAPEELGDHLELPDGYTVLKSTPQRIRNDDFSLNLYEVNFSTGVGDEAGETKTFTMNLKVMDTGENTIYPPVMAHNLFSKFGLKTKSETEYKTKEKIDGWTIVYSYDRVEKKGTFTALSENIFLMLHFSELADEKAKYILKDILNNFRF